ncbi:MAG TPA: polymer-forming cytoskeletal protein [Cyclobacteriaceae bacterium]|nr:polymer-forming cytoskeletal protein [Cyclobacteriaceae bacterium]MCB9237995.1 polymer-forming cytoskeletal protein [Flammeovirgaceae bacterium]MCB0499165.1 polymer-forming cytoskeletal protein [Cyclobacteriaceae bacterium]MCO5272903.1 polymer-forming cytoskeletal protein [Cyclobacteriaceae bacterium]MCW5901681.1 polymer-forming cytoskeletal protein [Cyclobacteriaceae bacterium]
MFTSKEQKKVAEEISNSTNTIGKGTVLEGNIETYGNIRIEGKVIGNIKSKSKIALGNSSHVEGNIIAQNADLEGEVKGRIEISEMLILKATAVVHGDIITGKLVVEPGAVFNGTCKMGTQARDIKMGENGQGSRSLRPEQAKTI